MTPLEVSRKPFSWQCGYRAGGGESDKPTISPQQNPVAKDTPEWHQWNEGYETAKRERGET